VPRCACAACGAIWDLTPRPQRAFERCPAELHKPLWEFRVVFLTRLGKSLAADLLRVKSLDPPLAAKVEWPCSCDAGDV
jgi:hypothetical protein